MVASPPAFEPNVHDAAESALAPEPADCPDRTTRALAAASSAGADVLLASDAATIAWLTGHAPPPAVPSPFALAPMAVVSPERGAVLVVSKDDHAVTVATLRCDIATYPGYDLRVLDVGGHAARTIGQLVGDRRVAIEPSTLPAAVARGLDWVDATAELALARSVKDDDELGLLRTAVRLCDLGQAAVRTRAVAGVTELELGAAARAAVHDTVGDVAMNVSLMSGIRTARIGAPPSDRTLTCDDVVLVDIAVRYRGYWGDSCATIAVGSPPQLVRDRHQAACDALALARALARPGIEAGDLDARIRALGRFPHHTGHGVGCSFHEEPRIIPGSRLCLRPRMVIALEPGRYSAELGLRVEQVVAITQTGSELLSGHHIDL
jgi:Xaa-Pro aminopeptidase